MAEDLNYAEIHFWLCIKYMHDCHESGELQGFYKFKNIKIVFMFKLLLYFNFI
jgi:hypothetical protein